jgi:AcrR family transcriptional regulator
MIHKSQRALKPRKMPVQARAALTVEAISEATIQVLLSSGADRLTTTRVAERAGVSVGTLYQYYPNKQSLLFAILEQQLDRVSAAVEAACEQSCGKPLAEMVRYVVGQFVDAKMVRTDISTALYRISVYLGGPELVRRTEERSRKALEGMIKTAPDVAGKPEPFAIQMMYSAMAGATRNVLEAGAPPVMVRKLREHLVLLCQCYVRALSNITR